MSIGPETKEETWRVQGKNSQISSQRNKLIASVFVTPVSFCKKYATSLYFPSGLLAVPLKFAASAGTGSPPLAQGPCLRTHNLLQCVPSTDNWSELKT